MHISDIHRSEADPISNNELLSCIITDCERFPNETPPISKPDAIVISGDLVRGLPLEATDYPAALEQQYNQAFDLLTKLADAFVEGDPSRVIVIPGNHDVDWNMARRAMMPASASGQNIHTLLTLPNSPYRWSWKDQQLFRIVDQVVYDNRFKSFCEMYKRFYKNARLRFPLVPNRYWNLFELADGNILLCAFNSCANNDCFSFCGEIPSDVLAQSHLALLKQAGAHSLRVAVWHHDVQGPPRRSDYMDLDTVRLMIDKGYRLGMHGHQHKSDASPYSLHTFEKHTIAVLSAGSLCAAPDDLPAGFNRQYNVVEVSDDYRRARVHVREMNVPGIFAHGRLASLGGRSYADVEWTPTPPSSLVDSGRGGGRVIRLVEEIEGLISIELYDNAIEQIEQARDILSHYGRQLLSKALFNAQKWEKLVEHLANPQNPDELAKVLRATVALKNWPEGERILRISERTGHFSNATLKEYKSWFAAEKGISK